MKMVIPVSLFAVLFTAVPFPVAAEPTVEIIVSRGDTLVALAERYLEQPFSWREIARHNRLKDPDLIRPGQALAVPARMLKGAPEEGVVSYARGTVEARLPGSAQWRQVGPDDRIPEGASLRTGHESETEVVYGNGHRLYLRPDTHTDITVSRTRGDVLSVQDFFLHTGKVIETIRKVTGRETRSKIRTPSATCAARGTQYRTSVDEAAVTRVEGLEGEVNVQAAARMVAVVGGEGTYVRKGEPPHEPIRLLAPPALARKDPVYKRLPLRLEFDTVQGAAAYRVSLTKDREGRSPVSEQILGRGEPFILLSVEDGAYFLHAWSIDEVGLEGLSPPPEEIRVRINPLPPHIASPAQGSEQTDTTLDFTWLTVPDAAVYHLQVAADERFARIVAEVRDRGETRYRTAPLDRGQYFFRLSSVAGDGYQGEWSDPVRVRIVPPPPVPVVAPPQSEGNEIRMSWQSLGEGITYRFQMARDREFTDPVIDRRLERPEISVTKPAEPGIYSVRTSAIDAKGREGAFSKPQSFEVKKRFPYELFGAMGALALILILLL